MVHSCFPIGVDTAESSLYFTTHSLGLQPKGARELVLNNLQKWATQGSLGRFVDPDPWLPIEDTLVEESARILGAKPLEVVAMNAVTVNCHLAMASTL